MSVLASVSLLFVTVVLQASSQSTCDEFSVTTTPVKERDYELDDVKLTCTITGDPEFSIIGWDIQNNIADTPREAYTYYKTDPGLSGPSTEFEGRLAGDLEGKNHTLTILNANISDNLNVWTCTVITASCSQGNKDSLNLTLAVAKFYNLTMDVNGQVANASDGTSNVNQAYKGSFENTGDVKVTCFAVSDPASDLSIQGLKSHSTPKCVPIEGPFPQPWTCSVEGTIPKTFCGKESKRVYCKANFRDEREIKTDENFVIIIELNVGEILFIIFMVLILIALIVMTVLCGVNCLCPSKLCCSISCTYKKCIPQMCEDGGDANNKP